MSREAARQRSEGITSQVAPWIAREAIRDLVARYNQHGDRGRIEPLLELFAPDATLEVVPHRLYRGRDDIRTLFEGAIQQSRGEAPIRFLRHFTATHQIDVVSDSAARGDCYFAVLTDAGLDHWGRYADDYARRDEIWYFAARRVVVDGQVPGGWGARTAQRLHGGSDS